ncbi:MAG: helix-turn-helix domain-containing protein [Pseudomonadales bacterium]|nr:helix-turn-helix domain-containing protein [Pseudomonadales bacterium]
MAAACAGTFILAATGLLQGKTVTTHWGLEAIFVEKFPDLNLDIEKILINNGNLITAGGMLSWLDLGLEVVAQFSQPSVMRQLGKLLVVDTGSREQRFYQQFCPVLNHGDQTIINIQQYLQTSFQQKISVAKLAQKSCLTDRTFLRRFVQATTLKPVQYLYRLRIQKACDLLETTRYPFDWIANQVGFVDAGACRKIFVRIIGLTPSEFRKRFH